MLSIIITINKGYKILGAFFNIFTPFETFYAVNDFKKKNVKSLSLNKTITFNLEQQLVSKTNHNRFFIRTFKTDLVARKHRLMSNQAELSTKTVNDPL